MKGACNTVTCLRQLHEPSTNLSQRRLRCAAVMHCSCQDLDDRDGRAPMGSCLRVRMRPARIDAEQNILTYRSVFTVSCHELLNRICLIATQEFRGLHG